ncbi:cysteine--1-D-myo-inosityl 2-amino-2-deoxy-alpha-D-glucopyranoside ligase [Actinomycetospora aeridis]|uniref:L-cysteine:1D-myo-inositol 2-amino-2-deoxy-alpha-D-glucopyranoside ligase n=1 Tax=Actinomycetospora aeridis TaxID=3129231 RepID=A0ABU8N573_9PSEU
MRAWSSVDIPRVPGSPPPLRLHDTASDSVRPTSPGSTARMYVCGITPYDATHLGHAATYLAFDLINRLWRDAGHDVHYVQNVTDIDDPLLERADRDKDDWVVLGMRETALFREDMTALRILPPREFIGAVEAVDEISELVGKLLASGAAYRADDDEFPDVYHDHTATRDFGYVSRYSEARMLEVFPQRGGDPERAGKRHPLDALLWRMAREGEPSWGSDLGEGRPGWHVECAAIALNRLGDQYDLQGGGSDLAFPHHEFGSAHAEALTGAHPLARHYCHAGMIGLDGEKMSKSKGNLVFVSRLRADRVDPMAVRLALLSGHWRTDRSWTAELLTGGQARLHRWREAAASPTGPDPEDTIARVRAHLADDLDTPGALAALDAWADEVLGRRESTGWTPDGPARVADAVDALLGVPLR